MADGPAGGLQVSEVVIDCADHGRVVDTSRRRLPAGSKVRPV